MVLWGDNDETNRRLTKYSTFDQASQGWMWPEVVETNWELLTFALGADGSGYVLGWRRLVGNQELWLNRYDPFNQSWSVAQQVADIGLFASAEAMPDGNATFVWMDPGDASNNLAAQRFYAGSETFSAQTAVNQEPAAVIDLATTSDEAQRTTVIWQNDRTIEASTSNPISNLWTTPVQLAEDASGPLVEATPAGDAVALWRRTLPLQPGEPDLVVLESSLYDVSTGTWDDTPTSIPAGPFNASQLSYSRLSMLPNGRALAIWGVRDGQSTVGYFSVLNANNMQWSAPATLPMSPDHQHVQLVSSSGGEVWLVWAENGIGFDEGDVLISTFSVPSGTWSTPAVLDKGTSEILDLRAAINNAGQGVVAWVTEQPGAEDGAVLVMGTVSQ